MTQYRSFRSDTPIRWRVIDAAFDEFLGLYEMAMFDLYPELRVAYPEGTEQTRFDLVLDRYLIPQLQAWPVQARELLAEALGAALVARHEMLAGHLLDVDGSPDGVDGIYGHVWRRLFEGQGWALSSLDPDPGNYEVDYTPLRDLLPAGVEIPSMRWPFDPAKRCRLHFDQERIVVASTGRSALLRAYDVFVFDAADSLLGRSVRLHLDDMCGVVPGVSIQSREEVEESARLSWEPLEALLGMARGEMPVIFVEQSEVRLRFVANMSRRDFVDVDPDASDAEIGRAVRTSIALCRSHPAT